MDASLGQLTEFCGVKIKVLPDFLLDHTMLPDRFEDRLPEYHSRWTQFVRRLWPWHERATFVLRFVSDPLHGSVGIFVLGRANEPSARLALARDLEFALVAYGIVADITDQQVCTRLLSPEEIAASTSGPHARAALAKTIVDDFAPALLANTSRAAIVGVVQAVSGAIWFDKTVYEAIATDATLRFLAGVERTKRRLSIPLAWAGPSGSFLLAFKALATSRSPIHLSIVLEPLAVAAVEWRWLEKIASCARRRADDPIDKDAGAALAADIAMTLSRRLLRECFAVAVTCAALDGNSAEADSVARSIQALCMEVPETAGTDTALPGTRIVTPDEASCKAAREAHASLGLPRWCDDPDLPEPLRRLSYLTDARGAATVFRLPVSVRGGVPGIEVRQPAPDFDPGPAGEPIVDPAQPRRAATNGVARLTLGKFETSGTASVALADFTKHTLITGFTGSGKTNTVLHLLNQFWVDHRVPFLVIESAKSEYRGLLGLRHFSGGGATRTPDLYVYTLGNESVAPMRLNPFELLEGVRVEAHVNRLQTCFEAALPPFGPLSSILEQSLVEVYRRQGWMMTDEGRSRKDLGALGYPTLQQFAQRLQQVGLSRGYEGEFKATLQAAIKGRILPLTRAMHGSKGLMLDAPRTEPPPETLFAHPTILELNDLNEENKALVSMFLLVLLREYREQSHKRTGPSRARLGHITVVEEAHNVLGNVQSVGAQEGAGADTRYKAVAAFCSMLTEVRALGEGLIIADQSPGKLAPDALRNTNVQIAHQLRDARDRAAMANAMIMSDEQRDFLGKLEPGLAGVFYTGLQKASFVRVPQFDRARSDEEAGTFRAVVPDAEVASHMEAITAAYREADRPWALCGSCGHRVTCDFRWPMRRERLDAEVEKFFAGLPADDGGAAWVSASTELAEAAVQRVTGVFERDAAWCFMLHVADRYRSKTSPERLREHFEGWIAQRLTPAVPPPPP